MSRRALVKEAPTSRSLSSPRRQADSKPPPTQDGADNGQNEQQLLLAKVCAAW